MVRNVQNRKHFKTPAGSKGFLFHISKSWSKMRLMLVWLNLKLVFLNLFLSIIWLSAVGGKGLVLFTSVVIDSNWFQLLFNRSKVIGRATLSIVSQENVHLQWSMSLKQHLKWVFLYYLSFFLMLNFLYL